MKKKMAALAVLLASTSNGWAQTPPAVPAQSALSQPALSSDGRLIAFVSGGDIWEVAANGGIARPLVTNAATESRPLYSPDGTRLAFVSNRGGSANIYVLDLASGRTTRLTWAESSEELDSWSPDGKWLYFASGQTDFSYETDVMRIAATGGTPMQVSREAYLSEFQASPSPDGESVVLAARGISGAQWWRNGASHLDQSELWIKTIDGAAPGYRKLLANDAKNAWPFWSADGQSVTFMSDAGGTENLWRMPVSGGAARQVTQFTDGRVLFPNGARDGSFVFERDMAIWRLDPATGAAAAVPITLRGAAAGVGVRHLQLGSWDRMALSPDGQKVALIGHGEIFAVSVKDGGVAQRITTSAGAENDVTWSPDSRRLLYTTERGLDRLLAETDVATGKETMLTEAGLASAPAYSPDGKSAAYLFGNDQLRRVVLASKTDSLLYQGAVGFGDGITPPAWSPDGKWVAFPVLDRRSFINVWLVPAAGGEARPISFLANGYLGKISWDPKGKFVLFDTAQRTEDSRIVRVDLEPHVPRYREDKFRDLFDPDKAPGTDDTTTTKPKADKAKPAKDAKPAAADDDKTVRITWDGLRERATILPIGLSTDTPVISSDGMTLVFRASVGGLDNLYSYNLDELADEPPVAQQISGSDKPKGDFALSADGETLVYLDGGTVISTPVDEPKPKPIMVDAAMDVDFDREKQVVFDEAWGILNQLFYDPGFNGQDWKALRARFQPYVAGAQTPAELRRTISLMIGELNASHSGIGAPQGGPDATPHDRVGDLGLRFDRDAYESGRGLIVRAVTVLGPADVEKVRVGDRLVSVDGHVIAPNDNLDALLENKVGARVTIGIVTAAGAKRDVVLQPVSVSTESGLAYRQWVGERRAYVDKMSGGKLGYVHMADMSSESLEQLYLDLDSQNQGKQGVVVDIRNNNGGFVNGYALDVFSRRNFLIMTPRGRFPIPGRQALGQRALGLPTVLVTNESSLSDAEDFSEGYHALGLGKVVGQPTSGWIIYTGGTSLIDGSSLRLPFIRVQDTRGQTMEMNPRPVDIAVERPLGETLTGADAQLDTAIAALLATPDAGAKPQ